MPVPTSLALTNIADSSLITAAAHRNNYSAIQTAVNGLITFLSTGNIILDDTNSKITIGGDAHIARSSAGTLTTDGNFNVSGDPGVDNYTPLGVAIRVTGVVSQRNVVIGAADSGGVGYRLLRVAN